MVAVMNVKHRKKIDVLLNEAERRKKTAEERYLDAVIEAMPIDELRELCDLFDEEPDSPRIDEIFAAAKERVRYGNKDIRNKEN